MSKNRLILIVVIGALAAGNVYFAIKAGSLSKELSAAENEIAAFQQNERVVDFLGLFIAKVLKADQEIDFETRLSLENAVRNMKDEEILAQWKKFVEAKTETAAQAEVKNLLEVLVKKISE